MYHIKRLQDFLVQRFPQLKTHIDEPADKRGGTWHLDIDREGSLPLVVEWKRDRGFGISSVEDADPAFGVRPDEVYADLPEVFTRVVQLIISGHRTEPPPSGLAELRKTPGLTRGELAKRAGAEQANISRSIDDADPAFGVGPDEDYPDLPEVFTRILQRILSGHRTKPPPAGLAELREKLGLTQRELAKRVGVNQARIAWIEGSGDIRITTLAKIVFAMSASLSIRVRFRDGTERELDFGLKETATHNPPPDV
jgi:transcriptional regulator with XRE-family HTH domain